MNTKDLTIITPVYNDWKCLEKLISDIAIHCKAKSVCLIAVNDCSQDSPSEELKNNSDVSVKIINLHTNLGHQRAILVGLCYALENQIKSKHTIIMDSDGEDKPEDITKLIDKCEASQNSKIIFAKRSKRSESLLFKVVYRLYKFLFRMMTGESISFGNFSCIPESLLSKVCNEPNFWNHYSSSVIKSRIKYDSVPTNRGFRYYGTSKMNFNNLVIHGLSSLSVYIESIIVRVLKFSMFLLVSLITGLMLVVYVKYFTELSIPGWASYIFLTLFNTLITVFLFNLLIILTHLNSRSRPISRPLSFYSDFINKVDE